jgi:hypothetical protein
MMDSETITLSPLRMVLIRVVRVYLQSFVGLLTAVGTGIAPDSLITAGGLSHKLAIASSLAVWPAVLCFLQNTLEIISRLDETRPELRG